MVHQICHQVRIDKDTLGTISLEDIHPKLSTSADLPGELFVLRFSPAEFVHAHALLGSSPMRFGEDIRLHLACVREFFDAIPRRTCISLAFVSSSDARRRLSEDLGVALAAIFMVNVFGVQWETISQIPINNKLSKKRPDFQGFDSNDSRYLFEAKGSTQLGNIEKALHKAKEQVKAYPEAASGKLAIATYLCADERLFPSTTLVVDPPAMPDKVPPSRMWSRMLHAEKVLQFAGVPETAALYIRTLAKHTSEAYEGSVSTSAFETVARSLANESKALALQVRQTHKGPVVGRQLVEFGEGPVSDVFLGVQEDALKRAAGGTFAEIGSDELSEDGLTSIFSDGTVLMLGRRCG